MKKILLSIVAVATLTIAAQARNAQDLYDEVKTKTTKSFSEDYLINVDKVCKADYDQSPLFVRKTVSAESTKQAVEQKFGTLSQTILKNYSGTGFSTTTSWGHVLRFYDEFLCTLSTKEKLQLVAFFHARAPSADVATTDRVLRQRRMLSMIYMYDTTETQKAKSFTKSADFSLIDNFSFARLATNWDSTEYTLSDDVKIDKNFKKFFSAIANRNLKEAKNIIENDKRTTQLWTDVLSYLETGNFPQ